jgi:hypothetical protein
MGLLSDILSKIFGHPHPKTPEPPTPEPPKPPEPLPQIVDVTAILDELAAKNPERLDWRRSIVDLLKLLCLDSSFAARKSLAAELCYPGDPDDSAEMNTWLHKQVLKKLAENGGKVPQELLY